MREKTPILWEKVRENGRKTEKIGRKSENMGESKRKREKLRENFIN